MLLLQPWQSYWGMKTVCTAMLDHLLEQKQMMVAETSIRHTQTLQTDTLPLDESISVHNEMASHAIIKFQLRLAAAVHTDS